MSCDVAGLAPLPPSLDRLPMAAAAAAPLGAAEEAGAALCADDGRSSPTISERWRACEEVENNFLRFVEMMNASTTMTSVVAVAAPAAVEPAAAAAAAATAASSGSDPSGGCLAACGSSSGNIDGGCGSDAVDDGGDNVRCDGGSYVMVGLGPNEQQQQQMQQQQQSCEAAVADAAVDVDPAAAGGQRANRVAFSLAADTTAADDAQQHETFRRPSSTPPPQQSASEAERFFALLIATMERIASLQHENSYLRQRCDELENGNRILEVRLQLLAHTDGFMLNPGMSFESQAAAAASGAATDGFASTKQRNASTLRVHRKPSYKDSLSHDVMWGAGLSTKHGGLSEDAFDKFRLNSNSSSSGAYSTDFSHDKTPHDNVGKFKGTFERVKNRLKGAQSAPKTLGPKRHYSSKAKDGESPDDRESWFVQWEINPPESLDDYGGVWLGYDESDYGGVWIGPSEVSIPEQSSGASDVAGDQAAPDAAADLPRAAASVTCTDEGTSASAAGAAGGSEVVSDTKPDVQSPASSVVPQAAICSADGAKDTIEQQHSASVQSASIPNSSSVPDESASTVAKDSGAAIKEASAVVKHVGSTAKDVGPVTRSTGSVPKDASAAARDGGAAARDATTFAKDSKMVTPPMSPSAKKKKKKASRSSSLAATQAVATASTDRHPVPDDANLVGSDCRTETVADAYLEALQKVEVTKEFARKYEEWYKRREEPENTDIAGDGGLSTKLLNKGAGSSGSSSVAVAALPPRSPGAPHRRWSTKAAAAQQVTSQPARGGVSSGSGGAVGSADGKLRNLPTSRSNSSLAAHGILSTAALVQPNDGGGCNNGGGCGGTGAASTSGASSSPVWLPQSQLPPDQAFSSPAAAGAHAAVGRSHSSAADRSATIRPQPAQLAAAVAVLPAASDKSKEKGKQGSSRSRFTQRVKRELEKRLTRSRERPGTRSKSCERTEDKITQDFAEKLREWSVKQGHDPDYYGNRMGSRARSTGSVAKDDELASPASNGRASPDLKSGASDSSLDGVGRSRQQDLAAARSRRAVGNALPSAARPPDALSSSSSLPDQQLIAADSSVTVTSAQRGLAAASARGRAARALDAVGADARASSESLARNGNDSSAGRQPPAGLLPETTIPPGPDSAAVQAELPRAIAGEQRCNAELSDVGSITCSSAGLLTLRGDSLSAGTVHRNGSAFDDDARYHNAAGASAGSTTIFEPATAVVSATAADSDAPLSGLATCPDAVHVTTDVSTNSSPCGLPLQPTELSIRGNGIPSAVEPVGTQLPLAGALVASAASLQAAAQPATRDSFSELDALVDNVLSNVSSAFRSDGRTLPTLVQPTAGISVGDVLQANSKFAAAAQSDANAWTRSTSTIHCQAVPGPPPAPVPAVDSGASWASRRSPALPSIDCYSDTGLLRAVPPQAAHSAVLQTTATDGLLRSAGAVATLAEADDAVTSAGDDERRVEHSLETCSTKSADDETCDAELDGVVSQVCVGQQQNRGDCSTPAFRTNRVDLVLPELDVKPAELQQERQPLQELQHDSKPAELQRELQPPQELQHVLCVQGQLPVQEQQLLQPNQEQQPLQEYPLKQEQQLLQEYLPKQEQELLQPNQEQRPPQAHQLQHEQQLMLQQEERVLLPQEEQQYTSEQQHLLEKQLEQLVKQPSLEQQPYCILPKQLQQQQCPPHELLYQQPLLQEQDPVGSSKEGNHFTEDLCRSPTDDPAGLSSLSSPEVGSRFGASAEEIACGDAAVATLTTTQQAPTANVSDFVDEVSRTVTASVVTTPPTLPSELSASGDAAAAACWQPAALSAAESPATAVGTFSQLVTVAGASAVPLVPSGVQPEIAFPLVLPAAQLEVSVPLVPETPPENRPDVNVSLSDSGHSFHQPLAIKRDEPTIGSVGHSIGDCGLQQRGRSRACEQTSAFHDAYERQSRTSYFERAGCGSFSDSADGSSDSERYDYSESDLIDSSPAETLSTASEELLGGSPFRQLSGSSNSVASASPGIVALAWKCDPNRQRSVSMGNCFAVDGDLPATAEESAAANLADSDVSASSDPALLDTVSRPDGHCAAVSLGYSRESLSDRLKALAAEYANENPRLATAAEPPARTAAGRRATNAADSGAPSSLSESVGLSSCRLRGVEPRSTAHDASLSFMGEKRTYGNSHTMPLMVSGGGGSGSKKALSPRAASVLSVQQAAEKSRLHPSSGSSVPAAVHALVSRFESQGDPPRLQLQTQQQQPPQSALSAAWNLPPRALMSPITKLKSAAELMTADSTKKSGGNIARDELFPCDIPHTYAKKTQGTAGISVLQRKSVKP